MTTFVLLRQEGDEWLTVDAFDAALPAAEAFVRATGGDLFEEPIAVDLRMGNVFERETAGGDTYAVMATDSPLRSTFPAVTA